ncbi:mechanosensitive ion channel family protein [Salegentibacter mishustinae]|uniref:Mechanosensitive ion channel protein n=1 Tax=Salegentibacter mishustinae TaxID=270918 RepID=A0A0Q9ZAT9_9FLAO|nr:mechanosensitive ion channel family protein [Salegentibacter mishustinae]KRG30143.1 mechanosensitive ion channel protein [Salegentibacter mishustinae]PNW19475.1 mechanosensitive ion channel protein [Salegentibacter mishustinae]PZX62075.1 small-conductance mechanosensitive channel [Salegentibacter mishustinae]
MNNQMRLLFLSFSIFLLPLSVLAFQQDSISTDNTLPSEEKIDEQNQSNYLPNSLKDYNVAYYQLTRLNNPLGLPPNKFNLQTPQATLEHFVISCRNKNFKEAAYALNFNLFPDNITEEEAINVAQKLYFVMDQRVAINWDGLSDRPDGQVDIRTTTNQAVAGKPRRSVVFGEAQIETRDIIFRLQRVKYQDYGAFWLISANTVENTEELYQVYGPTFLDRYMPTWSQAKIGTVPLWKPVLTFLLLIVSYILGKVVILLIRRIAQSFDRPIIMALSKKLGVPAALATGVLFFYISLNELISYSGAYSSTIYAILLAIVIASGTWFFMRILDFAMRYVAEHKIGDVTSENSHESRQLFTYLSVARRILTFTVVIIGTSIILSQFRSMEKLGVSMLASAGLATIILGIAAQSTLGNIIAGVQIALTKPARIGDTVLIEGRWGYVEDIRFTYMIVRTWDLRRLIVPLKTVISDTFENLSITSPHSLNEIELYVDYRVDVDKLRAKFKELLEASEDWDEEHPPIIQVTEMTEKSLKVRAICSASTAVIAWDLHCRLREQMVAYIKELEEGIYFTRSRVELKESHFNSKKIKKSDK